MVDKILVAYATVSGSTREVAETIGAELGKSGAAVDVLRAADVSDIGKYDAAIVGGPIVRGWHKDALAFLVNHQSALSQIPTAYFITCLNLTLTGDESIRSAALYRDPQLGKTPENPDELSFREKRSTAANHITPVLEQAPQVKPSSIAFLGGKMDYSTLPFFARMIVKYIIKSEEGDFRNQEAIREWAASLSARF